jgi:hypothetical protein
MAITEKEALRPDTRALLSQLAQAGFPVGYARIHSWHINPGDPSFTALLALYYNEDARREDPGNCAYYEIGGNMTQAALAAIQSADDRRVFYGIVEYLIHFQMYQRQIGGVKDDDEYIAALAEKQEALDRLDAELGLNLSGVFTLDSGPA